MPKIYKFKSEFEKQTWNYEKNKIHEGRHVNKSYKTLVSLCQYRFKKYVYLFTTRLNGTYSSLEKSFDSQYCILKINRRFQFNKYFSCILNTLTIFMSMLMKVQKEQNLWDVILITKYSLALMKQ